MKEKGEEMKKTILLLLLVCLGAPLSVQGHSALTSSNPAEGESIEEPLEEIRLDFEGGIEQGSTMSIESEEDSPEFEDITVLEQAMVGTFSEALPNGTYTVVWEVISADGHPLEGEILFKVKADNAEEEPAAENVEEESVKPDVMEETEAQEAADTGEESGNNWLVTLLIGIAVILLLVSLYGLFVKKR